MARNSLMVAVVVLSMVGDRQDFVSGEVGCFGSVLGTAVVDPIYHCWECLAAVGKLLGWLA